VVTLLLKIKSGLTTLWKAFNDAFTTASSKLAVIFGVIIGFLLFYLSQKNKQVAALQAQVSLVQTQKAADALESTIKAKLQDNSLLNQEVQGYNAALAQLQEKRQTLPEGDRTESPVDYWKNN
jgi:uncharacterized membrane protein YraQ (UPF0718 family)